jgi:putative redox protein
VSDPGIRILAEVTDPEALRVDATTDGGYRLTLQSAPQPGQSTGPMDTVLVALAGCTAMDVISILRKKRQPVVRYEIDVSGIRAGGHPNVFTQIVVEHRVDGAVDPEALRRSIELSATRYCPVNAMLSAAVHIEHRYRLRQEGAAELNALVLAIGPGQRSALEESRSAG